MHPELNISEAWRRWRARVNLVEYNGRWDRLEAEGHQVHGEACFVDAIPGADVLDAGCGTGRVAAELCRRGRQVVAVDNDPDMLALARKRPEPVSWILGDLAGVSLKTSFDVVVMAGNILTFVKPDMREATVGNLASHLRPGGLLISGSDQAEHCLFVDVDRWCSSAGLELVDEFADWDRNRYQGDGYRVSVHRRAR